MFSYDSHPKRSKIIGILVEEKKFVGFFTMSSMSVVDILSM